MNTGAECRIHAAEFLVQAKREPEREAHFLHGRILAFASRIKQSGYKPSRTR